MFLSSSPLEVLSFLHHVKLDRSRKCSASLTNLKKAKSGGSNPKYYFYYRVWKISSFVLSFWKCNLWQSGSLVWICRTVCRLKEKDSYGNTELMCLYRTVLIQFRNWKQSVSLGILLNYSAQHTMECYIIWFKEKKIYRPHCFWNWCAASEGSQDAVMSITHVASVLYVMRLNEAQL